MGPATRRALSLLSGAQRATRRTVESCFPCRGRGQLLRLLDGNLGRGPLGLVRFESCEPARRLAGELLEPRGEVADVAEQAAVLLRDRRDVGVDLAELRLRLLPARLRFLVSPSKLFRGLRAHVRQDLLGLCPRAGE